MPLESLREAFSVTPFHTPVEGARIGHDQGRQTPELSTIECNTDIDYLRFTIELEGAVEEIVAQLCAKYAGLGIDQDLAWKTIHTLAQARLTTIPQPRNPSGPTFDQVSDLSLVSLCRCLR